MEATFAMSGMAYMCTRIIGSSGIFEANAEFLDLLPNSGKQSAECLQID